MLADDIRADFKNVEDILVERGMLIDSNDLILHKSSKETNLTWSPTAALSYLFTPYLSVPQFQEVVKRRDFCFCLNDGSVIQIQYRIVDELIRTHRLSYIPCPFTFDDTDLSEIALCEIPDYFGVAEFKKRMRMVSYIRFDYDSEFCDEKHAHSHVSIGGQECRLPAYGPISIGHFMRFIFRYFYDVTFADLESLVGFRPRLYEKTLPHPPPHEFQLQTSIY